MYLRRCYRHKNGKRHAYWALVESYRTVRGPRQRVVAYLGEMDEQGRLGVASCAASGPAAQQRALFQNTEPEWVEVDLQGVRVERTQHFGGAWIGLELCRRLRLIEFLDETIEPGREEVRWPVMILVLVLSRLCEPSSELRVAERLFEASALSELLGVPAAKVNDDRLYRTLDRLLPHKRDLEIHLKQQLGELFDLDYDLLLYDVTSTYFEGEAAGNDLAQRGYSRDHRPDCKQVNIALVVSRGGMPLGYEVFAGNRTDVTTVEEIVDEMERRYGKSNRIWVMDRGMMSADNVEFLKQSGRRYILGTAKSILRKYERELLAEDWKQIHTGLEVKLCAAPDGAETFILCRSAQRKLKEQAMHDRFEKRIEDKLVALVESCRKRKQNPFAVAQRLGKLMGRNSRAAGLFQVEVLTRPDQGAEVRWSRREDWRDWARLSEGCYMLRTNVADWTEEELWRAYVQLTEAEAAFRIHKTDLELRPVWHQKRERVEAHILVCFLAYVLWKTLGQLCRRAGLGDEPRRVFEELQQIALVEVALPTRKGVTLRKRCIGSPTEHQAILLHHLGMSLPSNLQIARL